MRRFLFWSRLIFYPVFVAAAVAVLAACWMVTNLSGVVVWFAERSLPGFSLHVRNADLAGSTRIEFNGLELRQHDKAVLTVASAAVDFSPADLWRHHIARVDVDVPQIAIDDKSLPALTGPKTKAASGTGAKPWAVDFFSVHGGMCDVDLRAFPPAHFEFGGEFQHLELSAGAKSSRATQTVSLKNIRVTSRAAKSRGLVEVRDVTALFTMDQLAKNRLEEVIVASPSIHLRPELLGGFAGTAAAPKGVPSLPGPTWQLGRLNIKDGEFFLEDFGPSVPLTSAKFALDTTDLGLGGASERNHTVQLWDVRCAPPFDPLHPFLQLDSVTVDVSNAGLGRKEVAKIETTGMWLGFGRGLRSFAGAPTAAGGPGQKGAAPTQPWRVRDLSIQSGYIAVSDIGLGIPDLGFYLKTDLGDVALSGDQNFANTQMQSIELSNISIHSPLDPFVPVLTLKTIFVRFSIADLLRNQIQEVSILNPQIFVGEDLFWYADALKKEQPPAALQTAGPSPHWVVKNLGADFGQIVIANGGKTRATLPLSFSWRAQNVDFDNLDDLQLKLKLVIPKGDYKFPSYQLELTDLSGKIEFGLPPEEHKDNLVHTLEMKEVRWKDFAAQDVFLSVTYDKQGIYGGVGGTAYGGYVSGGFSFFTQADSPWTGWVSGSKVNLRGVTDAMTPQTFRMSGPADFKLEVNGLNHEIERVKGSYTMRTPGKLKVAKLDDVLSSLPKEWTVLKSSLTRIGLETLRDFNYDKGNGSFWFANDEGDIKLGLDGPSGARNMEAVLHGAREAAKNAPR